MPIRFFNLIVFVAIVVTTDAVVVGGGVNIIFHFIFRIQIKCSIYRHIGCRSTINHKLRYIYGLN